MWLTYVTHICVSCAQDSTYAMCVIMHKDSHMSHTYVTHICDSHMWLTYVWDICESCEVYLAVHVHIYICIYIHICDSHMWLTYVTHICDASRPQASPVTHMDESCHTCEWVTSHIWMSRVTRVDGPCHTCKWVMSHIVQLSPLSRVSRLLKIIGLFCRISSIL